ERMQGTSRGELVAEDAKRVTGAARHEPGTGERTGEVESLRQRAVPAAVHSDGEIVGALPGHPTDLLLDRRRGRLGPAAAGQSHAQPVTDPGGVAGNRRILALIARSRP